jgi:hypothetical protein
MLILIPYVVRLEWTGLSSFDYTLGRAACIFERIYGLECLFSLNSHSH